MYARTNCALSFSSGLLGLLQNGTIDIFADDIWYLTKDRINHFQFSFSLTSPLMTHMMRRPNINTFQGMASIFGVFTYRFYIAVAVVILSAMLIGHIAFKRNALSQLVLFLSSRSQMIDWTETSASMFMPRHYTLMGFLGYILVIVMGLYKGRLLTQLLFPIDSVPISSTEEMAAEIVSGRLTMLTPTTEWSYFEKINSSSNYKFRCAAECQSYVSRRVGGWQSSQWVPDPRTQHDTINNGSGPGHKTTGRVWYRVRLK